MHIVICSAKRCRRWLIPLIVAAAGVLLLIYPRAAATGVKRGLAVCGQLLIPSLFPFMVLAGFVIRSGIAHSIGRHMNGLMNRLFGLSGCASVAMLVSLVGGYPAGASAVTQLLDAGHINRREARRLLCCCVNAGPAFIIGGVGVGMLGSSRAGLLLLSAHWASSLIIALITRRPSSPAPTIAPRVNIGSAVTDSVDCACRSLIAMSGFVLMSCTAVSLMDALGGASSPDSPLRAVFSCILEVTTGCLEASSLGTVAPFLIGAALGFGGLSVHGQIAAMTAERELISKHFFAARLLHALLGGCFSLIAFRYGKPYDGVLPAMSTLSSVTRSNDAVAAFGLLSMILLCVILLAGVKNSES